MKRVKNVSSQIQMKNVYVAALPHTHAPVISEILQ